MSSEDSKESEKQEEVKMYYLFNEECLRECVRQVLSNMSYDVLEILKETVPEGDFPNFDWHGYVDDLIQQLEREGHTVEEPGVWKGGHRVM